MNVLIFKKASNYDLRVRGITPQIAPSPTTKDYVELEHRHHDQHYECLSSLKEALSRANINFSEMNRDEPWPTNEVFDAVITIGGDGTLLSASHKISDNSVILIGLRSSDASVGYLCIGGADMINLMITELQQKKLATYNCSRIKTRIHNIQQQGTSEEKILLPALNDCLIANENPAAPIRYKVSVHGNEEEQRSSGIWISTATGSSAGIYAAGGQEMERSDPRFQYLVRELFRVPGDKHCFQIQKGLLNPKKDSFSIECQSENGLIAIDGHREITHLNFGDTLYFEPANSIQIAKPI